MAFNYEYPYTDAQRYNDDWLINKVKELAMDWLKTSGEWTETQEAFSELKNYIADYFKNLDVQEEINEKLEAMKTDGSLVNIIKPLFDEYQQNFNVLSARMDSFTRLDEGATTGDAEMVDARVDYTGKTWDNLGGHIRAISSEIAESVFNYEYKYTDIPYDDSLTIDGYLYINQWRIENSAYNILVFPITSGKLYNLIAQFTYGNAKTFVLLKNLDNDGTGKIIDENEIENETRTVSLADVDTTGYNYVACSVPKNRNASVFVREKNSVKKPKMRSVLYVGAGREITKFSDAVLQAMKIGNCDVYVDSGTYDLIAEIGVDLMANDLRYKYGLQVGNGVRIFFSSGAKVTCNYTGDNESINTLFCILYPKASDFELHNADLEATNIRYCIHDETDGIGTYTHLYRDCVMKLDNTNNANWPATQCIGGGLGEYSTIIIDGGYYHSVGIDEMNEKGAITYHNPMSGKGTEFKNKVTIKNVYFEEGTCYVSSLGDSTKISEFYCSACSLKMLPYANGATNVRCIQWGNEVRQ